MRLDRVRRIEEALWSDCRRGSENGLRNWSRRVRRSGGSFRRCRDLGTRSTGRWNGWSDRRHGSRTVAAAAVYNWAGGDLAWSGRGWVAACHRWSARPSSIDGVSRSGPQRRPPDLSGVSSGSGGGPQHAPTEGRQARPGL